MANIKFSVAVPNTELKDLFWYPKTVAQPEYYPNGRWYSIHREQSTKFIFYINYDTLIKDYAIIYILRSLILLSNSPYGLSIFFCVQLLIFLIAPLPWLRLIQKTTPSLLRRLQVSPLNPKLHWQEGARVAGLTTQRALDGQVRVEQESVQTPLRHRLVELQELCPLQPAIVCTRENEVKWIMCKIL